MGSMFRLHPIPFISQPPIYAEVVQYNIGAWYFINNYFLDSKSRCLVWGSKGIRNRNRLMQKIVFWLCYGCVIFLRSRKGKHHIECTLCNRVIAFSWIRNNFPSHPSICIIITACNAAHLFPCRRQVIMSFRNLCVVTSTWLASNF